MSTARIDQDHPQHKLTIIGGGIIGYLEAYFAFLHRPNIRITIHEKEEKIQDTTTGSLVPALTPLEILSVIPKGPDLVKNLAIPFTETNGLRVDHLGINDSAASNAFIQAVQEYSKDEEGHRERINALIELGKLSMDLWQKIYDEGDQELKDILTASNFHSAHERDKTKKRGLHQGYRIDLTMAFPNARNRVESIKAEYERIGFTDCAVLSPDEVCEIDPSLHGFCMRNSEQIEGQPRTWKNDAGAVWRPGGCLDTQVFLPLFHEYLKKKMGKYFQVHYQRKVERAFFDDTTNEIQGLKFFGAPTIKQNKHAYEESAYVICTGEAAGSLSTLGFHGPEYARFAGASLMLRIDLPDHLLDHYRNLNNYMSVFKNGVSSAWQARLIKNQIFIGMAGTKAYYGDQEPSKNQPFAENRNLEQLRMMNSVFPEFLSLALGRSTTGVELTSADLAELENNGIAKRWSGSRAVAYDGHPTVGPVYNDKGVVPKARVTTDLGSGGASFGPAAVLVSRSDLYRTPEVPKPLRDQILQFGNSNRKGCRS